MSTADDAWQEWHHPHSITDHKGSFMAGYRRALEDAADGIDRGPQIPLPPSIYSALCREWAEDVGTKDGADDE